ncbi:SOS response-associated peptidase [Maritimibacter sp. DP1N21-5]|uniref:SOS response-associated peptidase n=1 Tax=Maritimibacter sp. DP1N21-5 TaxID=2836867 RepID=UPI001C4449DE|nr:SOS response-associated peptidase [Maritimibacter sp. DP1N21-5]MBV7410501.1 SOS response-associated peptidase [Maritimibacter sp. DP1N21-5]
MCGRMANTLPHDMVAKIFAAQPANALPPVPNFNVCPTTDVAVVTSDSERRLRAMRWGFIPHWYKKPNDGPLLINARSETVTEKPAFRNAVRERRCLVPVSGFYEWERSGETKVPHYFHRADGEPLVMAGIWQDWGADRMPTFAVLTIGANALMSPIHDRIPVVVEKGDWGKWLGEEGHGAAVLLQPPAEDVLTFHRVGQAVNSNRATGPELIEPVAA